MCSVLGCGSWRRGAQRFRLPEDPERRLEWVQFLFTVNKQRFKESSWTDITICSEHFTQDCFVSPTRSGGTGKIRVRLKPAAVPSESLQAESDEPGAHLDRDTCAESLETEDDCQREQLKTCDGPTSNFEDSIAARGSPVPTGIFTSADTSDIFISISGQMQPKNVKNDLSKEKAALLQMKEKFTVNENRLLQLLSSKCPLCGSNVKMEKVTCGVLLVLNQHCLQCEYRNQWKSQVNDSEDQHLTEVTPEGQQTVPTEDDTRSAVTGDTEVVAIVSQENDRNDEEELSDQVNMDSDDDWRPMKYTLMRRKRTKEEDERDDSYSSLAPEYRRLCTECGMFFNNLRPHTCEHKMKPYPCNICGKRCVSEVALNSHSRIHNQKYEYRCKYCHATFKIKVDKIAHEQTHLIQGKPYKCPDCSETFATNKDRRAHLEDHGGPQQLKCHICGIEFLWPLALQRHVLVHTGEKPFKCSVCQRGFNQASHLKSHMRLHTGERPYKCQHCDKRFNHNVSLKSHVQRYHSASCGHERKKGIKTVSDTVEAEDRGNKHGTDSGFDKVEEEDDNEEEVQRVGTDMPKKTYRSTGRPIGRPKRNAAAGEIQGHCAKVTVSRLKKPRCSDDESKDEPTDGDTSFDERSENEALSTSRSRGRAKNSEGDSDFDLQKRKEKCHSSQKHGKSSGKRRGR